MESFDCAELTISFQHDISDNIWVVVLGRAEYRPIFLPSEPLPTLLDTPFERQSSYDILDGQLMSSPGATASQETPI